MQNLQLTQREETNREHLNYKAAASPYEDTATGLSDYLPTCVCIGVSILDDAVGDG